MSNMQVLTVVLSVAAICMVDAAPTIVHSAKATMDSISKESQHIHANIHGRSVFLRTDSLDDAANVHQILGSPREGRSIQRKEPAAERYPSPHGKDARWRYDLRHTLEAEVSLGDSHSIRHSLQGVSTAALQRGMMHAHAI